MPNPNPSPVRGTRGASALKISLLAAALVWPALGAGNCMARQIGLAPASTPVDGRSYENLGPAIGDTTSVEVLFSTVSAADLEKALERALKPKSADALVNVTWHESGVNLFVISTTTYTLRGEAIRFKKEGATK